MKLFFYTIALILMPAAFWGWVTEEDVPVYVDTLTLTTAGIKAFPTAVGHGKNTTGGRGQATYVVNTLSGTSTAIGSIRHAVTQSNKVITFSVGGVIDINPTSATGSLNDLLITGSNLTFAGETAPGDGITIYANETAVYGSNIIFRNIRFRQGVDGDEGALRIGRQDTSSGAAQSGFVIDHCSLSWVQGGGETFSTLTDDTNDYGRSIQNLTFSNNFVTEAVTNYGFIFYGPRQTNMSVIGNFFAHNKQRNIRSNQLSNASGIDIQGPKSWEMYDNYTYHFSYRPTQVEPGTVFDMVGNVYERYENLYGDSSPYHVGIVEDACLPDSGGFCSYAGMAAYISGNAFVGGTFTISSTLAPYLVGSPSVSSGYTSIGSGNVKTSVLANAGARAWMASGLDDLDLHMVSDANTGVGVYLTTLGDSFMPTHDSGTPYPDDDTDGLSNAYESAQTGGASTTSVSPTARPASFTLTDGRVIQYEAGVDYATIGYTQMDAFLAELAGDWNQFTFTPTGGGGTNNGKAGPVKKLVRIIGAGFPSGLFVLLLLGGGVNISRIGTYKKHNA